MKDLKDRRRLFPAPGPEDIGDIRGLITEFALITPVGTDLEDLSLIFRTEKAVIDRLRRSFAQVTLAERIIFARFVLHYADPALSPNSGAAEACEGLIETAADTMLILALAERDIMSLPGDLDAIDRFGQTMNSGQPKEMGLWLAFAVIVNLTSVLGHDHYLVELARSIMTQRDPRRDS